MGWVTFHSLADGVRVRTFRRSRPGRGMAVMVALHIISADPLQSSGENASRAGGSDWVTRSWQSEDGLPQDTVNAVVQTHDGFLWVGTNAGLARFDGVRFRRFGLLDGLRSVYITALAEDSEGALWVGTSGGGLSRSIAGRFTSFGPKEGFPEGREVVALAADHQGSVWIGTNMGLVQWKSGGFKTMGAAEGLPLTQIRALLCDSSDTLWVSAIPDGLFRGTAGRFARVESSGPGPGSIYSLLEDRAGVIWAGSDSLWKWMGESWQRIDPSMGLPTSVIGSLGQSSDGTLWIGTRDHGLHRSAGERFLPAATEGLLSTQSVRAVMVDREGSVWAGVASGGLHRLAPRVVQFWGANAGLVPTAVTSVVEDSEGTLWVGTASRGLLRFANGRFSPVADPQLPATPPIIYCTTSTSDGAIWAAGEQCLFRFQSGQPTRAFHDRPVRGEAIRAICPDGDSVWLGTYASALLKCDGNEVRTVLPAGSLPGTITSLARESAETLWIGTSAALQRWERGQLTAWTARDGLLTANIRALHLEPDGTLWIGTLGGGLARKRDGKFVHVTTRDGLIDDVVSQILPDTDGALWLGCNRGLMRLDRAALETMAGSARVNLHPLTLGRNEGMLKEQCFGGTSPTAFKARNGHLFFPATHGLAEVDPGRLQSLAPFTPHPVVDDFLVDQQTQNIDDSLSIAPGRHRVEIAYTAPSLRAGEWVRFRHRLDGSDRDWQGAGRRRRASYDGLAPGRYRFRLAATDARGEWHESAAPLAFTVRPYFWQTLWFRVGTVFLLVGAGSTAAWRYLHHKHLRQLAALEKKRKEHAELAHASRVALVGELSSSLAHELKQPLTAILANAQAALRFLREDAPPLDTVRDILVDIAADDRRASDIISSLRSMVKKGEMQMETRGLNADIVQVLSLLHGELGERNISVETELRADLPPVRGDHIQLQQVVLNLILNGSDAMRANAVDQRRLVITTARNGNNEVLVSVRDSGAGIPSDVLPRVFEPFYTTKGTGLGMGLAICEAIIRSHDGQLWVENNPDRGATFHFTLPLGSG